MWQNILLCLGWQEQKLLTIALTGYIYNRVFSISYTIRPFPNTSAPARLRLPVPCVSTKPLKSSLSLHAKILFYVWNEWIKYCKRYHYEVNRSVLHVNC